MTAELTDIRVWVPTDRPAELLTSGEALPGVWVTSAKQSDRLWAEYHSAYTVCLVAPDQPQAGARFCCRGKQLEATAGGLMLFEPGDHHRTISVSAKADFSLVSFPREDVRRAAEELGADRDFHFQAAYLEDSRIAGAVDAFVQASSRGATRLELEWQEAELQRQLIVEAGAKTPRRSSDEVAHRGIRLVRDYLREAAKESPRLDELARIAGLSRFRLAHSFKRWFGIPPHAYLALVRASEARRSIERGTSIEEVAATFGYVDVPFLTRTLRRYFGVPPGRWRRMVRANGALLGAEGTRIGDAVARVSHQTPDEPRAVAEGT